MQTSIAKLAAWGSLGSLGAVAAVGCAESSEEPREVVAGKFRDSAAAVIAFTGGQGLNLREGPNPSSARIGWLAEGTAVDVACQIEGVAVVGNAVWDYLDDEHGYVADAYVNTGHASWIPGVPKCGAQGGCGDVDYEGDCDGTTLTWCENDELRVVDCAQTGQVCGWRSASIGNDCLASGGGGGGGGGGADGRLTIGEIIGGVDYWVTQDYGPTGFDGGYDYCNAYGNFPGLTHCGIDIGIPNGTPLYVPEDAAVVIVGSPYFDDWNRPNAENAGELRLETADGTHIILGHMSRIDLWEGQSVEASDWAGLSGYANGDHVHIEVRVRDDSFASGYRAVDPTEYFGL
ncbi:MAG TPA: peptidoglycan DD-metalloendopeptidase family protein [Nannocystaceae bacterium]|nr:peptidoglycan DD-metalloendopeptidase family protein [Nannocystaceae bacterium]